MNWIADTIARINNAILVKKNTVIVRGTRTILAMLKVMQEEGFIKGFEPMQDHPLKQAVKINLKYNDDLSVIQSIKVKSVPSLRKFESVDELRRYLKKFSCAIVTTPLGVMSNKDAIRKNVGGEVLCEVY
jgi:small subunit ribosomal protein S8